MAVLEIALGSASGRLTRSRVNIRAQGARLTMLRKLEVPGVTTT
jgi:hypothetical protein